MRPLFNLVRENKFAAARSQVLKIEGDSLIAAQRGAALRILTFLETKMSGTSETLPWAQGLKDIEGRAYALVGVASGLT
jgi:hypothetical protein